MFLSSIYLSKIGFLFTIKPLVRYDKNIIFALQF